MNKNFNHSKLLILTIFISIGIVLLGITYFLAYKGNFQNFLFWMSILLISIPVFIIVLDEDFTCNNKIIILFIFGSILYVIRILPSTINFHFGDEVYTFATTKLIYEAGSIDVTPYPEITKYYPGLEILTIYLKYFTNLDLFTVAKILIGIIHSFVLVFVFLFLREIGVSERLAAIGTFIYSTNPIYIFFHSLYSYESLGIFFVTLLLYIISRLSIKGKSMNLVLLALIAIFALVISHHLSSLMFLLFLILMVFIQVYKKHYYYASKWHYTLVFLTITLIFGWMVYLATITITYLTDNFISRFMKIFELSFLGGEKTAIASIPLSTSLLPYYEYVIDFLYVPLILLLSLIGIYLIKKERNNANIFISTMIIYGPFLYILTLAIIPTSGSELSTRIWGFVYIGVSFFVAVAVNKLLTKNKKYCHLELNLLIKMFSFLAVITLLIGGISIGDKPIHRWPDLLTPKLVSGPGSLTTDVFYASEWFESKFGYNNKMVGERTTSIIFSSLGKQDVQRWHAWKLFLPSEIDSNVKNFIRGFDLEYVIVDNRLTKSLAEYGYYFDKKENYMNLYPIYGSIELLPNESLSKFAKSDLFERFYDNGNIYLYKIRKWW